VGWDFKPTDNALFGVALDAATSQFNVHSLNTSGTVITTQLAAYGALNEGPWSERFDVVVGRHGADYARVISAPGLAQKADGDFAGYAATARAELARTFVTDGGAQITPFAAIDVSQLNLPTFTEGNSALALQYFGRDVMRTETNLGLQATSDPMRLSQDALIKPSLRAAWVYDANPTPKVFNSFAGAPGYTFEQDGASAGRDGARVDASAIIQTKTYEVDLRAGALLSSQANSYDAAIGVKFHW